MGWRLLDITKNLYPQVMGLNSISSSSGLRVLGRLRISRVTEESTSLERQRELVEQWAAMHDHKVVGWAVDPDVSGSVDPFDTPELGQWLQPDKLGDWDVLCAWKLDRLGRRAIPLNKLFGFCMQHEKTLVCVADNIDLSTWVGRLVANVIAGVAEGELEAIKERSKASRAKLLQKGRWPGGRIPYGLRKVKLPGGGWKLELDPAPAKVLRRVVEEVLDGSAISAVADRLNAEGVPSDRGGSWSSTPLWAILENPALIGHSTYKGEVVRDEFGEPVKTSTPIITEETWYRLQEALRLRRFEGNKRTKDTSRLLGVAKCLTCGRNLRFGATKPDSGRAVYRYYRCGNTTPRDEAHADDSSRIKAEILEELLEQEFLEQAGDLEVFEKVFIPAESHETALKASQAAIDELTPLLGTLTSRSAKERVTGQITALDLKIAELEQLPVRDAAYEYVSTGKTYRELWSTEDYEARRQLLLQANITVSARVRSGVLEARLDIPEDLTERMR